MLRPGFSQIQVEYAGLGGVKQALQASNVAFKAEISDLTLYSWLRTDSTWQIHLNAFPWKAHPTYAATTNTRDGSIRHGSVGQDTSGGYGVLPFNQSGGAGGIDIKEKKDLSRMRGFNTSPYYANQAERPMVIGGFLMLHNAYRPTNGNPPTCGNAISAIDLPNTQIGAPYQHPTTGTTVTTTAGASYVAIGGMGILSANTFLHPHLSNILRIESGPDRGIYLIASCDRQNNRYALRNIDGSKFVAQATTAGATAVVGTRTAYFNETGVIPNSTGQVTLDGTFDSGDARNSYIYRIHYEKNGSPSPADEAQRGNYWVSMRGFLYGLGAYGDIHQEDCGTPWTQRVSVFSSDQGSSFLGQTSTVFTLDKTHPTGVVYDPVMQRLWITARNIDNSNGSVGYWSYKSPESFVEVATSNQAPPAGGKTYPAFQFPAGQYPYDLDVGSDGKVYVNWVKSGAGTGSGLLVIKPDFTQENFTGDSLGIAQASSLIYALVDRSRFRIGPTGGTTTTSDGHLQTGTNEFLAQDIGRCIKISGTTVDDGTYLISSVNSATDVTVTLLNGTAVSLTGEAGGTYQIGDRIYLLSGDAAWGAGKINWTDSLAFGIRFTKTVTMTNGATAASRPYWGGGNLAVIDQKTGRLFWCSTDTTQRINMFDPAAQTVTQRLYTDLAVQVPGSSSNPAIGGNPISMAVNPNPYFRELWVAVDGSGLFKFDIDNFSAQFTRYYGKNNDTYAGPNGNLRQVGYDYQYGHINIYKIAFMPDGQAIGMTYPTSSYGMLTRYNRDADNWVPLTTPGTLDGEALHLWTARWLGDNAAYPPNLFIDPYGMMIITKLHSKNRGVWNSVANAVEDAVLCCCYPSAVNYQWIGGQWVAKEVVRGVLPTDSLSPGCLTKPLHSDFQELPMGVRIKFTASGAVNGENNEFLGRAAQRGTLRTDGATTSGAATLGGSGFSVLNFQASDTGRYYVYLQSGADTGVYKIIGVAGDNTVTLQKFNGVAFTATATAGTLSYSVWDLMAGSAVGPETTSFLGNHGFGKDNTQDINGIYADVFLAKSLLSEQEESTKFCVDILAPMGSSGLSVRHEQYYSDYAGSLGAHHALHPTPISQHVIDGGMQKFLNGTYGRADMRSYSPSGYAYYWRGGQLSVLNSYQVSVDLGGDFEIGSIILRGTSQQAGGYTYTYSGYSYGPNSFAAPAGLGNASTAGGGMIAHILLQPSSNGTPVASTQIRCSGTSNLTMVLNTNPVTTTGDFFGAATAVLGSDGTVAPTTLGTNVFQSAPGKFSEANVGMILKVTSGSDIGNYRIRSVSSDGSQVVVRNLDISPKVWSGAATGLSFAVYDGVQEEDMLCIPSLAAPTDRLLVEYISNDGKSAYLRTPPGIARATQSWQAVKPNWKIVKRLSVDSWVGSGPSAFNNGTYTADDGKESYGMYDMLAAYVSSGHNPRKTFKQVYDFSDLSTANRTGRWWKWNAQGRDVSQGNDVQFSLDAFEFYDTDGKRLFVHPYCFADTYYSQPQLLGVCFSRIDFIQASDSAAAHLTDFNGLADLGGTFGNTVTLAGGKKFLGYQTRPAGSGGYSLGGSNIYNSGLSSVGFATNADVGKFLNITSGVNAGVYRISTVISATQVTVTTPSGSAVTLAVDAGSTYSVHEGINAGTTNPDFLFFTTGGNRAGLVEYSIAAISDDLTTITLNEHPYKSLSGQNWEIRRRALEDRTQAPGTSGASARLLFSDHAYPLQTGDLCQDSKGYVKYWAGDIGGTTLTAGVAVEGVSRFQTTAGALTSDDVGRVIEIRAGLNKGAYRITGINSPTEVTLVNHFTGLPVTLVGEAGITYKILGERRIRMSRYVTTLRS